jgi:hypothetical protein
VGYILEIPVDAVEKGGDGGGIDVDVAGGAGNTEGVGLAGVEGEVNLRREVRHDAVQNRFGRGDGGRGLRGDGSLSGYGNACES